MARGEEALEMDDLTGEWEEERGEGGAVTDLERQEDGEDVEIVQEDDEQ